MIGAPTGMIMNSWKSTLLSACAPPLRMFIMGTGSVLARRRRDSGRAASRAMAAARAGGHGDGQDGVGAEVGSCCRVPSSSIMLAIEGALVGGVEIAECFGDFAVDVFDGLEHAFAEDSAFLSPSRSSTASCSPVEAPLGTMARPWVPSVR